MEKKEDKPNCQACSFNRTEQLTPIQWEYELDGHPIHGIDYQYRCIIHDMIVPPDYYCDKFELPF